MKLLIAIATTGLLLSGCSSFSKPVSTHSEFMVGSVNKVCAEGAKEVRSLEKGLDERGNVVESSFQVKC